MCNCLQSYCKMSEMQNKRRFFVVFYIFSAKSFGSSRKSSTFAPAIEESILLQVTLGYGVMVTLQILVLSFLVRVRVPQL